MKFKILFLLAIILIPDFGFTNPIVSGVDGTFQDNNIITISGCDFGSHADYASSKEYLAAGWEDLDDGSLDTDVFEINDGARAERISDVNINRGNSDYCANAFIRSSDRTYTDLLGNTVTNERGYSTSVDLPDDTQIVFISGWFMFPAGYVDAVEGSLNQCKFMTAYPYGKTAADNDQAKTFWIVNSDFVAACFEDGPIYDHFSDISKLGGSGAIVENEWHRYDIAIDTSRSACNKVRYFYFDGKRTIDSTFDCTSCGVQSREYYTEPPTCGSLEQYCPRFWDTATWGQYMRLDGGSEFNLYYDDMYVSKTWARIEVSDNAEWSESTYAHKEIQIPVSWSSDEITFRFNQGSFNDSEQLYLYIIDENNNASEAISFVVGQPADDIDPALSPPGGLDATPIQ
ncbi:MAG: hypothetical protein SWH61_04440 [Thermodesulfobacteriota bacterium]|nr:hypothetical protein [Thermodesulfobacteriota bacterium]